MTELATLLHEVVPNPAGWHEFWMQAGPWLILIAVFVSLCLFAIPEQQALARRDREARKAEIARADRVLDRRSSRVRAVEEIEKQIIITPTTDEILCDVVIGATTEEREE